MRSRIVMTFALLAVLGTACGNKADPEAVRLVDDVAAKTREAGSSRLETRVSIVSEQLEDEVTVTASGAFDFASGSGELEMNLPSEVGGSTFGEGTVRVLVVERAAFVQLPGQDTFIEVPADQLSGSGPLAPGNPSDLFAFLVGGPEGVEDLGTEDVRGQPMRHFAVVIDLEAAAEAGGADREQIDQTIEMLGTSSLPAELWIDEQGRLGRMAFSAEIDQPGVGQGTIGVDMQLFDYGVAVDVQRPPPDKITEAPL